jgi:GNAT superfamily N-acetyltransferase
MSAQDLPAAAALSRRVGWPHRLEDWRFVHGVGHGLVACAGDQLIGTAMWWPYEGGVVRLGMVIVNPNVQRSGVGRVLMRGILDRAGDATVVLNATKQGEPLYRQLGFLEVGSIAQHQGTPVPVRDVLSDRGRHIRPLRPDDLNHVAEMDAKANGASRMNVIAALLEHGKAIALDDASQITGFACCRRFGRGRAIGPVVTREVADAKALIAHFAAANAGQFTRVDVPGDAGLSSWLEGLGLAQVDTVVSKVRGAPPQNDGQFQLFGLINQALG